ncbi:hypothetical protein RFI_38635 [Reticulomyxa filosa]|uniref:Uncharacterized protein n=1 Tax=Reticulomyxa filosa TaxID=46433 RepID=X6L9Z9_RETFI|nr:hypothetical protein RFI_38635 [Reticulomyxa filosa]|eukprot:ETN98852.1 hypothetical protein RFI_38635 [Reticulomyxa filosa]
MVYTPNSDERVEQANRSALLKRFDAGIMWDKCVDSYILASSIFRANHQYKQARDMLLAALTLSEIYEQHKPSENTTGITKFIFFLCKFFFFFKKKLKDIFKFFIGIIFMIIVFFFYVYVYVYVSCVEHLAYLSSKLDVTECIKWCERLIEVIEGMNLTQGMNEKDKQIKLLNAKSYFGCVLLQAQDEQLENQSLFFFFFFFLNNLMN